MYKRKYITSNNTMDDYIKEQTLRRKSYLRTLKGEYCKSKEEVYKNIRYIKECNCKVGLAVKPETKIEEIYEFLPYIHM